MRAEHSQRGFVLLSVLLIAVLYFGLIELLLSDATQRLREARRFRATITANLLAENAAELVAADMIDLSENQASATLDGGTMSATYRRVGEDGFVLKATGTTGAPFRTKRTVTIEGTIHSSSVRILRTSHN